MTTAGQTYFEVQVDSGNTGVRDVALVDRAIIEIVSNAGQAWPGVVVAPEHFARFLSERAPDEGDSAEALRQVHGTDLRDGRQGLNRFGCHGFWVQIIDLATGVAGPGSNRPAAQEIHNHFPIVLRVPFELLLLWIRI